MITFLIGVLATWRLSELLRDEAGPAEVLQRFRQHAKDHRFTPLWGEVETALGCVWCLSVWCGWVVAAGQFQRDWFWRGLAYSAGALCIRLAPRWVKGLLVSEDPIGGYNGTRRN